MKLTLKPHPACKKRGELIDIYNEQSDLPWATVHIDTFASGNDEDDSELYEALYHRKETVIAEIKVVK